MSVHETSTASTGLLTETGPASAHVSDGLRRALVERLEAVWNGGTASAETLLDLRKQASRVLKGARGSKVYYRGLLEFSNVCRRNCLYCGIRAGNAGLARYTLDLEEIVRVARWCADAGYASLTLQSGERSDPAFVSFVEKAVRAIRTETVRKDLPEGLGITLCIGEQRESDLRALKEAGAHRYLLRVETSNPALYAALHPAADGGLAERVENLRLLRRLGFQVGTGVMIGLPGQTAEDLADDLLFFVREGVHMIGMGPYIPQSDSPLRDEPIPAVRRRFELGLAMIALARILMPMANVAATTALQALHPFGRELGLEYGANILMPLVTPQRFRESYRLYDGKPCVDEEVEDCRDCLALRVARGHRQVGYNEYGDSLIPVREGV